MVLFHIEDLSCYNAVKALELKEEDVVLIFALLPGGKSIYRGFIYMNNKGKNLCV